ncbi:MAG: signal peptide peptidase SppA [Nanoarchaeota archaeon]
MKNEQNRWGTVFITVAVIGIISSLSSLFIGGTGSSFGGGNVALIPLKGVILSETSGSLFSGGEVGADTIVGFIDHAAKDPSIKAIIIDINSPGGSPVATDDIANAVKRANKTTVALIHEVGASGAYWVASSTDHIVANRMSAVGSIGVISSYVDFAGFMDKYGLTYNRLVSGKYKDTGIPFRNLTLTEEILIQQRLDLIHDIFMEEVAANREMDKEAVRELATGEVYLGVEAIANGLIDELGGQEEAIAYLEQELNTTVSIVEYHVDSSLLDKISSLMGEQNFRIGQGIGSGIIRDQMLFRT